MKHFTTLSLLLLVLGGVFLSGCKKQDATPNVSLRYSGSQIDNLAPYVLAYSYNAADGQHNPIFVASDAGSSAKTSPVTVVKDQALEVAAELRGASVTQPVPAGGFLLVEVLVSGQVRRSLRLDSSTPRSNAGYPQLSTTIPYSEL